MSKKLKYSIIVVVALVACAFIGWEAYYSYKLDSQPQTTKTTTVDTTHVDTVSVDTTVTTSVQK